MDAALEGLLCRTVGLIKTSNILVGLNEENIKNFKVLRNRVSDVRTALSQLASIIEEKNSCNIELERLCEKIDHYQQYLNHLHENSEAIREATEKHTHQRNYQANNFSQCPQLTLTTPSGISANMKNESIRNGGDDEDSFISHISVQELNKLHKYMRGRLTTDSINSFVDSINSTLQKKYTILKQKKSTLKKSEQDLHLNWKILERNANVSADQFFFTAEDLMTLEGHKMDKISFSIIVILRHTKRLKEVRFESKLLYVVI